MEFLILLAEMAPSVWGSESLSFGLTNKAAWKQAFESLLNQTLSFNIYLESNTIIKDQLNVCCDIERKIVLVHKHIFQN